MPVIKIWGLPSVGAVNLRKLREEIKRVTAGIEELKLAPSQVTVLFPECMPVDDDEFEVIIEIDPIFSKPERTDEVMNRLAAGLGETFEAWWPTVGIKQPDVIECFAYPFNEKQGFWSSVDYRKEQNRLLHIEVVTGIVEYVLTKHGHRPRRATHTPEEHACEGKSEKAKSCIRALITRGFTTSREDLEKLLDRDYGWVWEMVNSNLRQYWRLNPVIPEDITI